MINGHNFADGEQLNIVGHSHGGNIGIQISHMTDRKIDNLVTLGTPARGDYQPNASMVGSHINVVNKSDIVQSLGGSQNPLSRFFRVLGEFGSAGRIFEGAQNVNATKESNPGPSRGHSVWESDSAWSKVDDLIN